MTAKFGSRDDPRRGILRGYNDLGQENLGAMRINRRVPHDRLLRGFLIRFCHCPWLWLDLTMNNVPTLLDNNRNQF